MKQPRLLWLVGVMCVLAVLRVIVPSPTADVPISVAEPIVRTSVKPRPGSVARPSVAIAMASSAEGEASWDLPGNAFAVRPPPSPPYVPPPAPAVVTKAKEAPAAPAPVAPLIPTEIPPPPVPYQVIGTWDDAKGLGVFLASTHGTVLARPGATLNAEYKVTAITPLQISLMHLPSKREVRLAITRPPNTPPAYP